jgi:hypothetical protein
VGQGGVLMQLIVLRYVLCIQSFDREGVLCVCVSVGTLFHESMSCFASGTGARRGRLLLGIIDPFGSTIGASTSTLQGRSLI